MTLAAIDKPLFGSWELGERLMALNQEDAVGSVTLVGLCTRICVISKALITKAALPGARVKGDAACCAGATRKGHQTAPEALKACQAIVENETKALG